MSVVARAVDSADWLTKAADADVRGRRGDTLQVADAEELGGAGAAVYLVGLTSCARRAPSRGAVTVAVRKVDGKLAAVSAPWYGNHGPRARRSASTSSPSPTRRRRQPVERRPFAPTAERPGHACSYTVPRVLAVAFVVFAENVRGRCQRASNLVARSRPAPSPLPRPPLAPRPGPRRVRALARAAREYCRRRLTLGIDREARTRFLVLHQTTSRMPCATDYGAVLSRAGIGAESARIVRMWPKLRRYLACRALSSLGPDPWPLHRRWTRRTSGAARR